MGVSERKERERELKKQTMLEAAEELILEKGLGQLNMDEVAEKAEVSKGSLYLYFHNKTDLVLGICNKATSMLHGEFNKVLSKEVSGFEMVYMIGATFIKFANAHPEFYNAMKFFDSLSDSEAEHQCEHLDMCRENMNGAYTTMTRAIQIGMQDGSIKSEYDPKELAVLLMATSHGLVDLAYKESHTPHFQLMEKHGIRMSSLFRNYMKMIAKGISDKTDLKLTDPESIFETEMNDWRKYQPVKSEQN
ncbi:TetR/AcrR family transcriptional regulator [Balneola sp. MJW-20]|uniref:TetR/AcrR family transcriptional regulator n=1 Tax=Gracilimonas aurantiaca TaxID=3234185 RepID=UPI003467C41E